VALDALREALSAMLFRSTKGAQISPRYLVGIFAYSTDVFDVLGGVLPIDQAAPVLDERLKVIRTLARLLMHLRVADGYVLLQNIYISDTFARMVRRPREWRGIQLDTPLEDPYARKLRAMSSPIPETYRKFLREFMNANLDEGSYMLFPGHTPEFIRFGFQMSAATGTQIQQ